MPHLVKRLCFYLTTTTGLDIACGELHKLLGVNREDLDNYYLIIHAGFVEIGDSVFTDHIEVFTALVYTEMTFSNAFRWTMYLPLTADSIGLFVDFTDWAGGETHHAILSVEVWYDKTAQQKIAKSS